MRRAPDPVTASVPARVHLAGNPSDGYGGAVVSATVPDFAATVTIEDADALVIDGPRPQWSGVAELARHAARHGHDGGDRLVSAAVVQLDAHLPAGVVRRPGRIRWSSTIPRSVGLGGSSAVVLATMRAVLRWWDAEEAVSDDELAGVALAAEVVQLGITAGIADRTVQAAGGVVLTDARSAEVRVRSVTPGAPVELTLLWNEDAGAPSGQYHGDLRRRFDAGDPDVTGAMAELAGLADDAAGALERDDARALGEAMDASLRLRSRIGPVPEAALAPVDELRRQGARVNFAGSGGALVVAGPPGEPVDVPPGWARRPIRIG